MIPFRFKLLGTAVQKDQAISQNSFKLWVVQQSASVRMLIFVRGSGKVNLVVEMDLKLSVKLFFSSGQDKGKVS